MCLSVDTKIKELYETTDLTLQQIADSCGITLWKAWKYIADHYPKEFRKERKIKNYSSSKTGDKNPMSGKTGNSHPRFIGQIEDGNGYLLELKPVWYTGREGSKHVFVHQLVICKALGLTQIPEGFCVHHIDKNKQNNDLDNLALMTKAAHRSLHGFY